MWQHTPQFKSLSTGNLPLQRAIEPLKLKNWVFIHLIVDVKNLGTDFSLNTTQSFTWKHLEITHKYETHKYETFGHILF